MSTIREMYEEYVKMVTPPRNVNEAYDEYAEVVAREIRDSERPADYSRAVRNAFADDMLDLMGDALTDDEREVFGV